MKIRGYLLSALIVLCCSPWLMTAEPPFPVESPARSGTCFTVQQDPEHLHKMIKITGEGRQIPYYHIGRSAYLLLDSHCRTELFLEDAAASGADTLRVFLTGDWRSIQKWNVNPWLHCPGMSESETGQNVPWWREFDESPNGYWHRLDQLLTQMEQRGMVAELALFDHFTFAMLEHEFPGEAVPFFSRIGSERDDGRLIAFLDRLILALQNHGNVIIEIGNQVCTAWFRHEIHLASGTPFDFVPERNNDLNCALWMKDIADYIRDHFGSTPVPMITNSSRFDRDMFFELTLVDGWNCPVSFHSNRGNAWWKWNWKAMIGRRDLNAGLWLRYSFPFVDNEPMKYGEKDSYGLTDSHAERFRNYAWISAIAGVYHTYHSVWGSATIPDRQLTPKQRAGAAYLPAFAGFVTDPVNEFHRLEPSPGTVQFVSNPAVETFAAAGNDRSIIAVYLLSSREKSRTELRLKDSLAGYKVILLDPATGKNISVSQKQTAEGTELTIPKSAWQGNDLLIYARK